MSDTRLDDVAKRSRERGDVMLDRAAAKLIQLKAELRAERAERDEPTDPPVPTARPPDKP